ncbi:MAG: hypothetical protein ABIW84_10900 [Ilumatobacteraceae bacterium]
MTDIKKAIDQHTWNHFMKETSESMLALSNDILKNAQANPDELELAKSTKAACEKYLGDKNKHVQDTINDIMKNL